jgi:hypothetical protein
MSAYKIQSTLKNIRLEILRLKNMRISSQTARFTFSSIAVLASISSATSVLAVDECKLPTLPGIDVSQVKIVKHISTRDRSLEKAITPEPNILRKDRFFAYSYNKVDLDGDGKQEILVRVSDPLVCGSAGCPISILKFDGRKYIGIDDNPLSFGSYIVTSHKTNGFKDIIIPFFLRDEKMYFLLQYQGKGKGYQKVKEYTSNLKIKGTAYLTCGTYHDLLK